MTLATACWLLRTIKWGKVGRTCMRSCVCHAAERLLIALDAVKLAMRRCSTGNTHGVELAGYTEHIAE